MTARRRGTHAVAARAAAGIVGLALAASGLALLPGCRGDSPLPIRKILVDIEPAAEGRADRELVRDALRAALQRSRAFEVAEGKDEGAVVRLRLFVAADGHGTPRMAPVGRGPHEGLIGAGVDPARAAEPGGSEGAGLEDLEEGEGAPSGAVASGELGDDDLPTDHPSVQPPPAMVSLSISATGEDQEGRYHFRGAGVVKEESSAGGVDLDAMIVRAVEQAVDEVALARSAQGLPSEELVAKVADPASSPMLKRQAIQVLGKRKEASSVPALADVLLGDDKELSNTALRALTDIGDPRAVEAIITFADGKPSIVRRQAIEAVKVMGTRKGQAWLFTLSTGHPDPDVQTAASSALAALGAADEKTAQAAPVEPGG